jgi:aldehyde:ferredoxin oxidoreductase
MELYQRGIISQETTDGLRLEWGNEEATIQLLHKIAHREGFGDILADGTFKAAQRIGKDAMRYAMHVGGATLPPYEYRSQSEVAHFGRTEQLGTLTCPRGGDNLRTSHMAGHYLPSGETVWHGAYVSEGDMVPQFISELDMPEEVKKQVYGSPPRMDRMSYERKPPLVIFCERVTTLHNILGLCFMSTPSYGPNLCTNFLNAITGTEISQEELMKVADRVFTLQWAFNAREGITLKSLDFPERFYEDPIQDGPRQGDILSREKVKAAMAEYYKLRHWDKETGLPTRGILEDLGLGEVITDFERRGLLH